MHTTLPLTAQQVHDTGREAVADLTARMTTLGADLGLAGFAAVREAALASGSGVAPEQAMAAARDAMTRAEVALPHAFGDPLPPP